MIIDHKEGYMSRYCPWSFTMIRVAILAASSLIIAYTHVAAEEVIRSPDGKYTKQGQFRLPTTLRMFTTT